MLCTMSDPMFADRFGIFMPSWNRIKWARLEEFYTAVWEEHQDKMPKFNDAHDALVDIQYTVDVVNMLIHEGYNGEIFNLETKQFTPKPINQSELTFLEGDSVNDEEFRSVIQSIKDQQLSINDVVKYIESKGLESDIVTQLSDAYINDSDDTIKSIFGQLINQCK